jgi:cytochrome c oxidase subunit 3
MNLLRKVTARPWEHAGELDGLHGEVVHRYTAGRIGLTVFLLVISSLFGLFMVSYYSRSLFPDWEVLSEPAILWFNTVLLALASIALQRASNAAKRNSIRTMRQSVLAGAVLTVAFIGGQFLAWSQLVAAGYYLQANPAFAFFYLLTGLHALHLAGGLWYLGRLGLKMSRERDMEQVLRQVSLSATYWHYLLLVWLAMFALLLLT